VNPDWYREIIGSLGPHEWLYVRAHDWCLHDWRWWPYGPQGAAGQQFCARCSATRPGVIRVVATVERAVPRVAR
jgi:hypothetical protein